MPAIDPTTLGEATERAMQRLEMRIMRDIVRRIRDAEFSTASADWQISRLQQLGHAEEQVKEWVQDALGASDEEIEEIFSDEVYRSYVGNEPAYRHTGKQQTPYSENYPLQQTVRAMHEQTSGTLKNITRSMGFVEVIPGTRRTRAVALTDFYQRTLDDAIYDIQSGAFDYTSVLKRTVSTMTRSGIRQIDYASGSASRIDVVARRAVMTGFRQVQGKISEQTAAELGTDTFEVSYHGGARPSHAEWQGGVYTKQELTDICGLGDVTGLCGANCYHTYWPFIPGVDKPVYSADELERMRAQDQQTRTYQGKEYTPYEATQAQRDLERRMRKDEEDLYLLREGGADEETLALKEAHLNGLRQTYSSFSDRMELPKHWERTRVMDPDGGSVLQDISARPVRQIVARSDNPDIIRSGAITGARNPDGEAAQKHAERYYGLIRSMKSDTQKIAAATEFSEEEIRTVKEYLFLQKHDLGSGEQVYFDPDFMIAESWRRLQAGVPEPHDITLIKHELLERKLIGDGLSQEEAHLIASRSFNYAKEAREFYDKIKKYKTDR